MTAFGRHGSEHLNPKAMGMIIVIQPVQKCMILYCRIAIVKFINFGFYAFDNILQHPTA